MQWVLMFLGEGVNLRQNIHFAPKSLKAYLLCSFSFPFNCDEKGKVFHFTFTLVVLITSRIYLPPNQKRRETRNCLQRATRALIELMYVGKADTLSRPIVAVGNTVEVKIRTTVELCIYLIHLPPPSLTEWAINVGETISRRVLSERSEFTRLRSNRTFD